MTEANEFARPELPELTLEQVDRDGAIVEAIAATQGHTRAETLRKAAFGGAALLGALAAPASALGAGKKLDVNILNFDLVFEHLQSTFYVRAVREGTVSRMRGEKRRWAHILGAHEIAHVKILKQVLGRKAVGKPFFDFHGVTESVDAFTRTAVAMEDLTVALLSGQAPKLYDRNLIAAVFTLLTTEARHAAWARRLAGFVPLAGPFDEPKTLPQVDRFVYATRFVSKPPLTISRQGPRFTG